MPSRYQLFALIAFTVAAVGSVAGHHQWPVDNGRLVTVKGTVLDFSWANPHPMITLEVKNEAKNANCQRCHTTGFAQPTGFPTGGKTHQEVGCESCHGPGKRHVDDQGKTPGTILALTDKCDSCAIALICGTCHDDANDPGFEFEVESKLAAIKHGFRDKKTAAK